MAWHFCDSLHAALGIRLRPGHHDHHAYRSRLQPCRSAVFLSGLFQATTPDVERGTTITARDVLDLSVLRINKELIAEPEVRAAMLNSVGKSYLALGLYDQAQPLLEQA